MKKPIEKNNDRKISQLILIKDCTKLGYLPQQQ
jgi:hypothetical protein